MSSFPEENKELNENPSTDTENKEIAETEPESTIFSNPAHYNTEQKQEKKAKQPLLIKVIAAVVAVSVLSCAAYAAVKLIPEIVSDNGNTDNTIAVISTSDADVEKINITNSHGSLTLNAAVQEKNDSSEIVWTVDGVNPNYTESSSIAGVVKNLLQLTAVSEVAETNGEYGFDKPLVTAEVQPRADAFSAYTVTVGDALPAGLGNYCRVSTNPDKVYVIDENVMLELQCVATDFAVTTGFAGIEETSKNTSCFSDGSLIDFDYLTLSGKKFPQPMRIEIQEDDAINAYFAFQMVKPMRRIANNDTTQAMVDLMSDGMQSVGAYAFDPSVETLKKYGLDNPDYIFTISVVGEVYTLKASVVDELYCAMIDETAGIIHKMPLSTAVFAATTIEDFYSSFIILENLSGLSQLRVETAEKKYVFDLKYTEATDDKAAVYQAFYNGKELEIANFKTYYQSLIGMSPISFESKEIPQTQMRIVFVHSNGTDDVVLEFKEYSGQRYQVELDGMPLGLVTKTEYDKFIADTKKTANGEAV